MGFRYWIGRSDVELRCIQVDLAMRLRLTNTWYSLCYYHFEQAKKMVKAGWCKAPNVSCSWTKCERTGMYEFYPIGKRELAQNKERLKKRGRRECD